MGGTGSGSSKGSGNSRFSCLLDHVAWPCVEAELRCFSSGFVVERLDRGHQIPLVVSLEKHVRQVWVTDLADTLQQAQRRVLDLSDQLPQPELKELRDDLLGYLVTFEFHPDAPRNPLSRLFPALFSTSNSKTSHTKESHQQHGDVPRFFSIFVRLRGGEVGANVLPALEHWKAACRMHDVPLQVGNQNSQQLPSQALPTRILQALLVLLDRAVLTSIAQQEQQQETVSSHPNSVSLTAAMGSVGGTSNHHDLYLASVAEFDSFVSFALRARHYLQRFGVPGLAHVSMR